MTKPDENGWRPIETAPKDGTDILAHNRFGGRLPDIIRYEKYDADVAAEVGEDGYWRHSDDFIADVAVVEPDEHTHWQPLPKPPVSS